MFSQEEISLFTIITRLRELRNFLVTTFLVWSIFSIPLGFFKTLESIEYYIPICNITIGLLALVAEVSYRILRKRIGYVCWLEDRIKDGERAKVEFIELLDKIR
jgi:hypothetical protein